MKVFNPILKLTNRIDWSLDLSQMTTETPLGNVNAICLITEIVLSTRI